MTMKKGIALASCGAILFVILLLQLWEKPTSAPPERKPSAELLAQLAKLPTPEKTDNKNLDETMKVMGRAFRRIKTAQTTADMRAPLDEMMQYAEQAQCLGLAGAPAELAQGFVQEIKILRLEMFRLKDQIDADDFAGAQEKIALLDQMRRSGHRNFKN